MEKKPKTALEIEQVGWLSLVTALILLSVALTPSICVGATAASASDFHPIDLSPLRAKVMSNAPVAAAWSALPRGMQTFGGVPFRIDGQLELTGIDDASNGEFHPPRLPAMTVGRKAARIHLLHGTVRGDKDGVPLARVIFSYANGEHRSVRLAYGVHARNWVQDPEEIQSELLDPGTRLAWTTANDDFDRPGASLRLFQTALVNPMPEVEVHHVEIVSMFSRATPFICALTIDSGAAAPPDSPSIDSRRVVKKSRELEDSVYFDEFIIRAVDVSSSQPVPSAHAVLTISNDETAFYFGDARADATGTIRLPFPPQQTVAFTAVVRAPGRVPFIFSGTKTNGGDFSRSVTAELQPGVTIGGIVGSQGGQPIPNAEVVIYKLTQDSPLAYTRIDYETVRSGPDGRWSSTSVPADLKGFYFHVSHPEHRSVTFIEGTTAGAGPVRSIAPDQLLSARATFELPPATRIEGIVMDNSFRKPVANAEVHLMDVSVGEPTRTTRSDAKGSFTFIVPELGEMGLMIQAAGYRPKFQPLPSQPASGPLTLAVTKASPLNGRVIDQSQQPVAGARIKLDTWNGTRLLQWQAVTDEQGRFVWDTPAEGNVMLRVSAPNHTSTRMSFNNPAQNTTIRLRRLSQVVGQVTDAETGKPIDDFTVIRGRSYNYNEPMRWNRYDSSRGRRGQYVVRIDDYSSSSGGGSQIMVEAPGYVPAASPVFSKGGLYTNDFALKKGRGIHGVVQLADGTPVVNATVVLVERSDNAYMDRAGELRRSGSGGEFQRSNSRGEFEFPAKLEPHTIFAAHELGFAEVRASNVVANGRVVLESWGRVKGTLRVSHLPEQEFTISLQPSSWRYGEEGRTSSPLSLSMKAEPDENGGFVFEKVPPGERRLFIQFKLNDRDNGRTASSHTTPATVKPNETTEVTIGGEGRTVIGRVKVVGGEQDDVDWQRDVHTLQSSVTIPVNIPPPRITPNMSEEDRRKAQQDYNDRMTAFWRTDQGRALERTQRSYVPLFDTNGTFRIGNVEPGSYSLYISVTNPERPDNYYEQIGSANKQITIPPASTGKPDEPFDIGEVELTIRGVTRVGRLAPRFEVKTFDGKPVKLDDFKGKYVLLDFWATWAGTRALNHQTLKAIHESYGKDDRLVIIGLNFDHDRKLAETALTSEGTKWTQCYLGGWNGTTLPASFGVQGLPEVLLIDPDGKIAAKSLRGSTIRTTVRRFLSNPRPAISRPAP